jgi:hypothetical protein
MASRRSGSPSGGRRKQRSRGGAKSRRDFVKTTVGVIAAVAGLPGCEASGDPPTPPPGTATVRISVTGLAGANSGGMVTVNDAVQTLSVTLPAPVNGTSTADATGVPPGPYTAIYTPPAGFQLVDPTQSPTTFTLVADQIHQFDVACQAIASGTVSVTATGITGAAAGGTASAIKSDQTGSTFTANLPAPTSGSSSGVLTGLPAGNYGVTYSPPSGFQLVNPGSATSFVDVSAGGSAAVQFACQALPAGALLFQSDWSTGLGNTTSALRDTNQAKPWTQALIPTGAANVSEVVSAAGLGFPAGMTNVLRIRHLANTVRSGGVQAQAIWPAPGVGQSLFFRVYLRNEIADSAGDLTGALNGHHPIEPISGNCAFAYNWTFSSKNDGTFPISFNTLEDAFPRTRWRLGKPTQNLLKNHTYRLEWRITRVSNGHTVSVRIYDQSGTLVFDDNNIWDSQGTATLAAQPVLVITNSCLDKLFVGTNGPSSFNGMFTSDQFNYFGGVMVRSDTWCGAY